MQNVIKSPSKSRNPSGWRKESGERAYFARLAKSAVMGEHSRQELWRGAQRAMRALKVHITPQKLLETLVFRTFECDWEAENVPIVWLSNSELAYHAGLDLRASAVRSALSVLADSGFITYRDSGNCRRAGGRKEGKIIFAFGIDLSILAARNVEFIALADHFEAERLALKEARSVVQRLRRMIPAHLQAAILQDIPGRWSIYRARYDRIVCYLGRSSIAPLSHLRRVERVLVSLLAAVQKTMLDKAFAEKTVATPTEKTCLLETTNQSNVICNKMRNCANAQSNNLYPNAGYADDKALEKKPPSISPDEARAKNNTQEENVEKERKNQSEPNQYVYLDNILKACPIMQKITIDKLTSWQDIDKAAGNLRPSLGISPDAWMIARQILGNMGAATALAIIAQKHDDGIVQSPGAYLRGIIKAAEKGELHLNKTIHALIAQKQKYGNENKYIDH